MSEIQDQYYTNGPSRAMPQAVRKRKLLPPITNPNGLGVPPKPPMLNTGGYYTPQMQVGPNGQVRRSFDFPTG